MSDATHDRLWALLDRFLAGECAADEAGEVRSWLAADPAHRELLESARRTREIAASRPPTRSAEEAWRHAVAELGLDTSAVAGAAPEPPTKPAFEIGLPTARRSAARARALWAATVAALLIGGAAFWRASHDRPPTVAAPVTFATYATQPGQRLSLRLSDGSLVVLAPGSTLRKPSTYGRDTRTLHLEGEAYFDVVHDASRPMAVHTAHAIARDLGTRFVVRAYPDDAATDVVVAEGEVAVDSVVLARGHRARVQPDGRLQVDRNVALEPYFEWIEGRLAFEDAPLREVAIRLTRWYDVDVRLGDPALADRRLTATFADVPVTEVLDKIRAPLGLDVVASGRTYTLHAR